MTDLRQAAQQALEYMDAPFSKVWPAGTQYQISTALREALAAPMQEPVAVFDERLGEPVLLSGAPMLSDGQPLYTAPPAPQPLTDKEIDRITDAQWGSNNHKLIYAAHRAYARAIERAHNIGGVK